MGHFHYGWLPMDPAAAAALTGAMPLPSPAAAANGAAYCVDPAAYASVPPHMMQPIPAAEAEAARRRQEEEDAAIRLVHLLVTCAGAIQAGDYSAAHGSLAEARGILSAISTATGIGRLAEHFAAALAQRLFPPANPHAAPTPPPPAPPAELYHHFYEAAPYLKFAHFAANQAILEAFEGCDRVHVVDLALMQGHQWPALIHALAKREGGPPSLRFTGIGPPPTGGRDELREVGLRLAELARSLDVPFTFRGVSTDQLDGIRTWMLDLVPGEEIAVNSVLQLHRLLVDPDADPAVPAPIDILLDWVTTLQPRVFTVVEVEADHNKPALLDRFTNALFHYAAMFDSMEAVSSRAVGPGAALAEAYLQGEIFDIVCGEGSARAERHEPLRRWQERLARVGLGQVPFGATAVRHATALLLRVTATSFAGAGFGVWERDGGLSLAWHDRPLYTATAWRAAAAGAATEGGGNGYSRNGSSESNSSGNLATAQGAAGAEGIIMQ
ncbi:hypothetical protein ACP70R_039392 [Stipagrostis hirtigluma subsp. patula]